MLEPGSHAPDFSLRDMDGKEQSLHSFSALGRTLAVFFKISCSTCQLTLPFLNRLRSSVNVVGISQDDAADTRDFLDYFKISFPVLVDPASEGYPASSSYRLSYVPSMFLIEPDQTISWALDGFHRGDLESLSTMLGTAIFLPEEKTPLMKPG